MRHYLPSRFRMKLLVIVLFLFSVQLVWANGGVVKVIPAPDYPYGLAYDGTNLWVGCSYANSADVLYKIDPADGTVLGTIPVPNSNGYYTVKGLAYDGQYLWVFEDLPSASHPDKFYKVDPATGTVLKTLNSPKNNYVGGLAFANGTLWYSDYYGTTPEGQLVQVDTSNGATLATIVTQGEQPMGVAFDGQFLWCVEDSGYGQTRDEIYQYDPSNQTYTGTFIKNPVSKPRDMAYDGTYLWLIHYGSREIYQIDIRGGGTPAINLPVTEINFGLVSINDTLTQTLNIQNTGDASLTIDTLVFSDPAFFSEGNIFPIEIPVGGSTTINVSFAPLQSANYNGTMSVHSNDPVNPVVDVTLIGQGQYPNPTIWVNSTSHDFGDVWVPLEGKAHWKLRVANDGNQMLEIVDLILNSSVFSVSGFNNLPITLAPDDTVDITVTFQPVDTLTYVDTLIVGSTDPSTPYVEIALSGRGVLQEYNTGFVFWNYQVPDNPATSYQEYEVDGLITIDDINGDGVAEVIAATENYYILCLDGASSGEADTLWTFSTYISSYSAGSIGGTHDYGVQDAIDVAPDLNNDGYNDIVIATGGGNEHVYAISGLDGQKIWEYGTDDPNSYGLGDFEAVDCKRDFNNDGVVDVLAIADGNDQGTGYKSAYLFNGTDGAIIWTWNYPGPNPSFGKSIISIDDVTFDGIPDAVAAIGDNNNSATKTYLIDGATGFPVWDHVATNWEPKELLELPIPGETPDVISAEYFSTIKRLDGETGTAVWTQNLGGLSGVIQMDRLADINNDGIDEILIANFSNVVACLSGADGQWLWSWSMDFQYGVQATPDLNGDGYEDVIIAAGSNNPTSGTFYCLSGKGDQVLFSAPFTGDRPNVVAVMPSIDGNSSAELLVGTKYGQLVCYSGGMTPLTNGNEPKNLPVKFALAQNYPNPFNPETRIPFTLPAADEVTLRIFNVLGQEVATVLMNERLEAGPHQVLFNAASLPSGIYMYRLESRFGVQSRKMILMK
ncbi:MAG: hypothetical protein Kow0037_07620 [Calditrichia bacterium]